MLAKIMFLATLFIALDLRQARTLFDQRRFAEAAEEARRARELDPANAAAWKLNGLSLQLARRSPEAVRVLMEAVKKFPNDAELWFYLSRVQYLSHELRAAEESARTALSLNPGHGDSYTQLGMILEAKRDTFNALKNYETAVAWNSKQRRPATLPLINSAQLLMKLERLEESLRHATVAEQLDPHSSRIRLLRGRILEKLGRKAEAQKEYQEALRLDGNPQARSLLERLRSGVSIGRASSKPLAHGRGSDKEGIRFRNVAATTGINFALRNSATPQKHQIETMPGGVGVVDYNSDGWQDIYFANGAEIPSLQKTSAQFWNRLYRNNKDGSFSDVTAEAGVAAAGYSMGIAAADYDNDGHQDLFVAGVNRNILFRNKGDGTFADTTSQAKLEGIDPKRGKMWSVAAAWVDYDNDGKLDLFVVNYCKWSPSLDPYCGALMPGYRTYCFPDRYEGLPNQLFRNNGDGTFTDVSSSSGIATHIGKGMGVAIADLDDDGWTDIFVANDTVPNFLFRNNGRGGFQEIALQAGVAVPESAEPVSGMGVDFRDYDNDGRPDLVVSALEGETFPLFRNLGRGFFGDETYSSRLGMETAKRSGWSLGLFDFNNDGHKDLFTVNAHVNDNIELFNEQTYRQTNSVFVNRKNGTFQEASALAGPDFQVKQAHRGCAFGDFNNDGKIDVVTTSLNEPAELFINDSPQQHHWLAIQLVGTRSNRDGMGARIKLISASGQEQFNHATTSVGYASSSERRIHFGLGSESRVRTLEVRWPSGTIQTLRDLAVDRVLTITER